MDPEAAAARGAEEVVKRLPAPVRAIRAWLLKHVERSTTAVVAVQRACGVLPGLGSTNSFINGVAVFSAALGNEITFITLLPTLFWELDLEVPRRAIWLWVSSYFFVHVVKDTLCLPRPPAFRPCAAHRKRLEDATAQVRGAKQETTAAKREVPHFESVLVEADACSACVKGVVKLEHLYAWEFGFPSSHTHNAFSMPLLIAALTWPRFDGPHIVLAALAAFWVTCGTLCRLYLGVHSVPDVIGGALWGLFMLGVHLVWGSTLDSMILHSPPLVTALVGFAAMAVAMALYPKPRFPAWVATPGDTTIICAVAVGVATAVSLGSHAHIASSGRTISMADSPAAVGLAVLRVALGFAFLLTLRAAGKAVCGAVLPPIMPQRWADADDGSVRLPGHTPSGDSSSAPAVTAEDVKPASSPRGEDPSASPLASPRSSTAPAAAASGVLLGHSSASARSRKGVSSEPSSSPASGDPAASPSSTDSGFGSSDTASSSPASGEGTAAPARARVLIPPQRNYWVELPTKMVVYSSIGFAAVYVVPRLFQALGLKQYGL